MFSGPARAGGAIEDRAADWLSRYDAGLTPAEVAEFHAWLAADPRHAQAVERIKAAWQAILRPAQLGGADAMMAELERRARVRARGWRRFAIATAASGLAAALLVFGLLPPGAVPVKLDPPAAVSTVAVRAARQILDDGSVVELDATAEIVADFSAEFRTVRLLRGTAHFAVEHDPARPFVVVAGPVAVRAVGTQFAVNFDAGVVDVVVNQGRVAIEHGGPAAAADAPLTIAEASAGRRVTVPLAGEAVQAPRLAGLTTEEVARALAWRMQRVEFSGTRLSEAIELFNRQNDTQLALGDDALGELRVSGIFWLNSPEGFARLVGLGFGLRADRASDTSVVLRR